SRSATETGRRAARGRSRPWTAEDGVEQPILSVFDLELDRERLEGGRVVGDESRELDRVLFRRDEPLGAGAARLFDQSLDVAPRVGMVVSTAPKPPHVDARLLRRATERARMPDAGEQERWDSLRRVTSSEPSRRERSEGRRRDDRDRSRQRRPQRCDDVRRREVAAREKDRGGAAQRREERLAEE